MTLTATFSPSVVAIYQPAEKPYLIHKSTWDEVGMSRPTQNKAPLLRPGTDKILAGLPDVYRYRGIKGNTEQEHIELNQDKQHYLLFLSITRYKNLHWTKDEYFKWFYSQTPEVKWAARELSGALTHDRSHTNALGMDNCNNYLTGEEREGLPKFSKIITGWARLFLYGGVREVKTIPGIGRCIAFQCIDASKDLWRWNWWEHPELFDEPCITGREVRFDSKGSPYIYRDDLHYPYTHFAGRLIFPKWLPNSDKGFVLETLTREPRAHEGVNKF